MDNDLLIPSSSWFFSRVEHGLCSSVTMTTWSRTDGATTCLVWIYLDTLGMWLCLVECSLLVVGLGVSIRVRVRIRVSVWLLSCHAHILCDL